MKRTRLRNKFMDSKTDADRTAYDKQSNYCVSLIPKEKKAYYNNINPLSANITKWSNTLKTIRRQIADELFEYVWPFCGIGT